MSRKTRVILVGIGGATCSGKTTLAKHLHRILPNSVIIHQDDFAPPQELVPMHPVHNVQDWDAAPGAIDWPRLVDFLRKVKATGEIPGDHRSHDHLNEQKDLPIPTELRDRWVNKFERLGRQRATAGDEEIVWGLVDGFLLYWHPEVIAQLDVRIYLRVPHDVLRARRHERHGYHTAGKFSCTAFRIWRTNPDDFPCPLTPPAARSSIKSTAAVPVPVPVPRGVQSDPEGTLWRDPPHYWEQIVYPAYVDANRDVFEGGDVEKGAPTSKVAGLVLLESLEMTMGDAVERSCEVVAGFLDA